MDFQNWISLGTICVAVSIPYLTFRLASRQEHQKWVREQRLEAYVEFVSISNEVAVFFDPDSADAVQANQRYVNCAVRVGMVGSPVVVAHLEEFDKWFTAICPWPGPDYLEPQHDRRIEELVAAMRRELGLHHGIVAPLKPRARDYRSRNGQQSGTD